MDLLKDILGFIKHRKKYWLAPAIFILFIFLAWYFGLVVGIWQLVFEIGIWYLALISENIIMVFGCRNADTFQTNRKPKLNCCEAPKGPG